MNDRDPEFDLPADLGTEILRVEVGSTLHGTGLGVALEDHDEMGIFLEKPASTLGLGNVEHWIRRTAGEGERSGPGDVDLVFYSARKWCRLALKGNPSVLLLLFAPADKVMFTSPLGDSLRWNRDWFASLHAGRAFLGYMERQRMRMTGERGRAGRIRVIPDGGIDHKYAMHMLRLGYQGVEYLTTGTLTLPVPDDVGEYLREVRQGRVPFDGVVALSERLEAEVRALLAGGSPLPAEPDRQSVEDWLVDAHLTAWDFTTR